MFKQKGAPTTGGHLPCPTFLQSPIIQISKYLNKC